MSTADLNGLDIRAWEHFLRKAAQAQPGCTPYTSTRPIRIPGRMQGKTLGECLALLCPHIEPEQWVKALADQRLTVDGRKFELIEPAFGGMEMLYTIHGRTEPEIATDIDLIALDDDLFFKNSLASPPLDPSRNFCCFQNDLLKHKVASEILSSKLN